MKKNNIILRFLTIILPIVIILGMGAILAQNYIHNNQLRSHLFTEGRAENGVYDFDDFSVAVITRGGDSGSWMKDAAYDENGDMVLSASVGTIYEIIVSNKSPDIMSDWEMTLYMPEELYLNNSWNGELELHQNTASNEQVQFIDLADYSKYDIKLDHFIDWSAPWSA